jgi:hypothetical protein
LDGKKCKRGRERERERERESLLFTSRDEELHVSKFNKFVRFTQQLSNFDISGGMYKRPNSNASEQPNLYRHPYQNSKPAPKKHTSG